ncbi:MAG: ABC transporter ATP-binding protein [Clostridia bacterium]|nr:ABC transporter ATP-binding protein [Clostridia bacterium]
MEELRKDTNKPDDLLVIEGLTVFYETDEGTARAVNDLSIRLKKGSTLGLVGETGSGKTTTALAILRLVPDPPGVIKSGTITLDGIDIMSCTEGEMDMIRGSKVSMIFQDPMTALNPVMSVEEQIAETLRIHEGMNKHESLEKARDLLAMVGIPPERGREYPHQFSGGMKQRVIIAIAFACSPKLLIADEPTTALDVTIQAQILREMRELKERHDMSMILITHDLGIVAQTCDQVAVIYAGRIVEYGTLRDIFKNAKHPYTEGLFGSLPRINEDREMLDPIPGLMPDPMELPPGCAFAPRCRYASDRCSEAVPEARWFGEEHYVCCSAYDDPGFALKGGQSHE